MNLITLLLTAALAAVAAPASADDNKNESGKDARKEWRKDREKAEKDYRKADKDERKHAQKQDKEWRKAEEKWHKEHAQRWDDGHRGRGGDRHADDGHYFRQHGYSRVNVPNGHLPPPGECRIWYPGRPAGHQPPPGRCSRLAAQVPASAWLIERPSRASRYYVSAYDPGRPHVVLDRAPFAWQNGVLVLVVQVR